MQNSSFQSNCVILQNLDLLIVSFGGVGTSFFMDFFKQHKLINCRHNNDGLKHLVEPPLVLNPNLKAIYIFGDPVEATVSLFRRGYHHAHSRKISPNIEATLKVMSPETSLEDYLAYGKDLFGFERHYQNWSKIDRPYPVLFIHYSYIWDYLKEIFEFVGLSRSLIAEFPAKRTRNSKLADLDREVVEKLNNMYGEFQEFIENESRFRIKEGQPNTYFSQLLQLPAAIKASQTKVYWRLILSSYLKKPK